MTYKVFGGTLSLTQSINHYYLLNYCSISSMVLVPNLLYTIHVRQKTAPFYFCNSFVRISSITIIFGTHMLQ